MLRTLTYLSLPPAVILALTACNTEPPPNPQGVGYRTGLEEGEPNSAERGTVKISEVMWSGSVDENGNWDPSDVFVELRNESARPVNMSGWQLSLTGSRVQTWVLPKMEGKLPVGDHLFIAAKSTGCFPEPDLLIPEMAFVYGDPLQLTLRDADDRLVEPIGDDEAPPFAGGYDGVQSRSMERLELMFGGEGGFPHSWHFYTDAEVDVPNNDNVAERCRANTFASPGRPNSPDYSGAFATGSFE
ncbi:MAG: lamin tail domain-containing protein [Myxococcales bacterium]|nr:lamin tail domain-containing protein [Myxococcales bacterium]